MQILGVDRQVLVSETEAGFRQRLRLQKAAYLLSRMGVKPFSEFEFNIYLRGPYSPDLAKAYYSGADEYEEPEISQDKLELLKWFMSHEDRWLEIASGILSIQERYRGIGRKGLLTLLRMSKPWITENEFNSIFGELKRKGLVERKQKLLP